MGSSGTIAIISASGATPNIVDSTGLSVSYESDFAFSSKGDLYFADCGATANIYGYPTGRKKFSSKLAPSVAFTDSPDAAGGLRMGHCNQVKAERNRTARANAWAVPSPCYWAYWMPRLTSPIACFTEIDRVNAVSTLIGRRLLKVGECGLQIAARIDHVGLSRERRSGADRCEEERKNQSE